MRVLFTGHRGFLGKELVPRLSHDFDVRTFQGDLVDKKELTKFCLQNSIEYIVHSAARGGRRTRLDNHLTYTNNVQSFINVASLNIPTITFCSGAIFGKHTSIDGMSEDCVGPSSPIDPYGKSKHKIWELSQNLDYVSVLRFFNVFGELEDSSRFIRTNILNAINNRPLIIFEDITMDFFYIEDAFRVVREVILGNVSIKDLNLVYAQKNTLFDICQIIIEISRSNSVIQTLNRSVGLNYYGDGSRLERLGVPLAGLDIGIQKCHRFFKEYKSDFC